MWVKSALTFAFDPSLDRDSCEDYPRSGPLASGEFVIVHDDREEHGEELPCQGDRARG